MLLILALCSLCAPAFSYHVLCVHPYPVMSHHLLAVGLATALLDANHEVTLMTPFPNKVRPRANLTVIDVSVTQSLVFDMAEEHNRNVGASFVKEYARNITSLVMSVPAVRQSLTYKNYDAVVTESALNDIDAGFAAVQQAPWIVTSVAPAHSYLEYLVDELRTVATHPHFQYPFSMPMTLGQRLTNSITMFIGVIFFWFEGYTDAAFYNEKFSVIADNRRVPLPPFKSAMHNISILFLNTHSSIAEPRSFPPNVVDVAGYHMERNPQPLPKDLQDLLDSSTQGVIYFSLGSIVKSSSLHESTQRELLKILGEIPYTVLWKFEKKLTAVPKNVHVRAWFPQASILAHPNMKLFISHAGLLSTLEAVYYGVPALVAPVFADHYNNAERAVRAGYARSIQFSQDLAFARHIKAELAVMLKNDSYAKKAKEVSNIYRTRPVAPSELITHYIELAIKTKGAYHLRSPTYLYAWYERWMLDQLAIFAVTLYVLYSATKKAIGLVINTFAGEKIKKS